MLNLILSIFVTILIPLSLGEALIQYTGVINLRSVITHQPLLVLAFVLSLAVTINQIILLLRKKKLPASQSSDALALISSLQAKGRLLDFALEDITAYSDAQVSAAARIVHSGCREVIEKGFAPEPVVSAREGSTVTDLRGEELNNFRLSGKVGRAPFSGKVVHRGWRASKVELPQREVCSNLIAPAELEVQ